jgi:hypothetical protein
MSGTPQLLHETHSLGVSDGVQIALRVLTGWMDGQAPSLDDVKFLQSCKPELKHLPVDELACIVMEQHHRRN